MTDDTKTTNLVTFDIPNESYPTVKRTMTIPKSFIVGIQTIGDTLYLMMKDGRNDPVNIKHFGQIMRILEDTYDQQ